MNAPLNQEQLIAQIEALFAKADPASLREVSRQLEKLVRQVQDPGTRARYEAAIDQLPDMVKHLG